jgi:hypothetical protein
MKITPAMNERCPHHREYAEELTKLAATAPTTPKINPWGVSYVTQCGDYAVESWDMPDGSIYGEW